MTFSGLPGLVNGHVVWFEIKVSLAQGLTGEGWVKSEWVMVWMVPISLYSTCWMPVQSCGRARATMYVAKGIPGADKCATRDSGNRMQFLHFHGRRDFPGTGRGLLDPRLTRWECDNKNHVKM